ncbi:hypothetical protein [uncultured Roseobacter sp.]
MFRCRQLSAAAERPRCRNAWHENRRRL